ncbi:hypothetical protein V3C99_014186 [Haemonchus contortus]
MSCTEDSSQETTTVEENGRNTDSISNDINHTDTLSDDIGVLLGNRDFSDIILVVNGEKIPANKALLAARKVTFRGLLYGGLKESGEGEVVLNQTNVFAFRILLRYLYTAKISLAEYKDDQLLEILGIAHQYCVFKLQNAIADHFKRTLNCKNVCTVFSTAQSYCLTSLTESCLCFADQHASEVLLTQGFLQLSIAEVTQLVSRDSFVAPEINIFCAIQNWVKAHPKMRPTAVEVLKKHLILSQISRRDLLKIVWPSKLLASDILLDVIDKQDEAELKLLRKLTEEEGKCPTTI